MKICDENAEKNILGRLLSESSIEKRQLIAQLTGMSIKELNDLIAFSESYPESLDDSVAKVMGYAQIREKLAITNRAAN